jgi:hypothetical protein
MGLQLDLAKQIRNVNWGGLAVEFTREPSYLTLQHALSMNKVVISVWFRVPSASVEAAQARAVPFSFVDYRIFLGVIPLITWGEQQTVIVTEVEQYDSGAVGTSGASIFLERISGSRQAPMPPSYIGIRVGSTDFAEDPPLLDIHIQTDVHATGTNLMKIGTSFHGDYVGIWTNPILPSAMGKPVYQNVTFDYTDVSYIVTEEFDYFGNSDANASNNNAGHPDIGEPDQWHHLLISWDLKSHSSSGGASKIWCAIDNKNKDGDELPAMNDQSAGMGPNDHMSSTCFLYQGNDDSIANISLGSDDVPANPFGIPSPPSVNKSGEDQIISIAPIETIELAELQIFSGVTLDTSEEENRRAFIDYKRDSNGDPIEDEDGKKTLKPIDPKRAEELLGQKPDILLHGSAQWKNGKNTGSLGVTEDGETIPEGQFQPTGEIKQYTPDPKIIEA